MGGRGRGGARGRGLSFNVEQLGFGRGEALPTPVLQPPVLFPALQYKPVPLVASEEQDYLLSLKQEYRGRIRESAFFIKPPERKRDIERYSDKYHDNQSKNSVYEKVDWDRVPSELKPALKKKRKVSPAGVTKPNVKIKKKASENVDIDQKLKELEKTEENVKEEEDEEKPKANEDDEEPEVEEDEFYDEEEQEEGTDYISSYFDNGEGYLEESEDNLDDGPIY